MDGKDQASSLMEQFVKRLRKFKKSTDELSRLSGLNVERVQQLVDGSMVPSLGDLINLANGLKVSTGFLIADDNHHESYRTLFRNNNVAIEDIQTDRVSYLFSSLVSVVDAYPYTLSIRQNFPKVQNTYEDAHFLASLFRELFFNNDPYSPILNLGEILSERLHCIYLVAELGGPDGASALINGIPYVLLSPRFSPRMLFTLAHELGHILSHHSEDSNFAIIDNNVIAANTRTSSEEAFAHNFASELLLPRLGMGVVLKQIRSHINTSTNAENHFGEIEILYLSRFFGVSFEVAALRCENLQLIPPGSASAFYRQLTKKGKNPESRARELNLPPRQIAPISKVSKSLVRIINERLESAELSIGQVSEMLSISAYDLMSLNQTTDEHTT